MFESIDSSVGDFDDLVENDKGCLSTLVDDDPARKYLKRRQFDEGFNGFGIHFNCPTRQSTSADSILLNLLSAPSQPRQPKITPALLDTLESRQIHTTTISPSPRAVFNIHTSHSPGAP